MYAIIDIETTGGQYDEEGITDIAIYKFDGHQIVDRFISLINPERKIQPFVAKLTGINNAMLVKAPKFFEVAKRIVEITSDCVLVAHNANFDARILTTEFRRIGYKFSTKTLCTVDLSKVLIPDMPSYKLGNLCKSLRIPLANQHRADGDALATLELFKLLLEKDTKKEIVKKSILKDTKRKLAPKLLHILDILPSSIGLFYVHNNSSEILYVGKARNIRKSVNNLFLNNTKKAKTIQKKVTAVSYHETGNELILALKFEEEIAKNKPVFNYSYKKRYPKTTFNHPNLLIIDKGRNASEKSVILLENNKLKGYCFTMLNYQTVSIEVLKKILTPVKNSATNRRNLKKYIDQNHIEKLIRF